MSVETVLKQLFTFVTTLNKAHSDQVKKWDAKSLQNAFNWARYAEEVHMKLKARSFVEDLDKQIKVMTVHLSPASCCQMSFDELGKASQIMFLTLMQNPYFPESLVENLFLAYMGKQDSFSFRTDAECSVLSSNLTTLTIGQDMMKSSADGQNDLLNVNSQAKLLLDGLSSIVPRLNETKADSYIKILLQRMTEFKNGISVIVTMYLQSGLTEDDVSQMICTSIIQYLQHNTNITFENVPVDLLVQTSSLDFRFLDIFINWLINMAQHFSVNYPEGEMYEWKFNNAESSMDFRTICSYFSQLSKANEDVKKKLQRKLKEYSMESFANIFRDILKNLQ
ncbi:uncharacterized protein LOC127734875 [Mytilus californianus]|uniref:uncharacterized protein LOC127734875 n=1 Tax=Mytilus californianus TaxID=6549 RepID=UPI002247AD54|nr:uncharacterized protein LOC127734875 [Mytilus californianus]